MSHNAVPLLKKATFNGNDCFLRDREACFKEYEKLSTQTGYSHCQNARKAPEAEIYVQQLLLEAPEAKREGELAIVTGVTLHGIGFYIARELAVQAGMHVILLGKSERGLQRCKQAIQEYHKQRQSKDENGVKDLVLFTHKFYLASLESVEKASQFCSHIASQQEYGGRLSVLINQAHVGSSEAKLTQQGIEYNTGCNFVATHYFITSLLPLLEEASTPRFKPRVTSIVSMGHAFGRRFEPQRLVQHPKEGGAPKGFIIVQSDGSICEYEPPQEESIRTTSSADDTRMSLHTVLSSRLKQYLPKSNSSDRTSPEQLMKVGTQVGRSKMALLADTIHFAEIYPNICFSTYHAGATINPQTNKSTPEKLLQQYVGNYLSCSQAARAPLRAALDPNFNTEPDLQSGIYLHADGNPWTPMEPNATNPSTGQLYTMYEYSQACYEAAEELLRKVWRHQSY